MTAWTSANDFGQKSRLIALRESRMTLSGEGVANPVPILSVTPTLLLARAPASLEKDQRPAVSSWRLELYEAFPNGRQHHADHQPRRAFARAPQLYSADRGFFSEQNVAACVQGAVTTVCIPQRGGSKTPQRQAYEKSAPFKQGQRFRAGIEGRISVLMRGRGMKRCRAEGAERFALFVGAAVLANNLMIVAALLTKRSARRRKATR